MTSLDRFGQFSKGDILKAVLKQARLSWNFVQSRFMRWAKAQKQSNTLINA